MSVKEIHIVFQVLNFLHSDLSKEYQLLPVDKLVLINLASHKGKKGICPSTLRIAQELGLNKHYIERRLKHLSSTKLITIAKSLGKRNQYHLNIPCPSSDSQVASYSQVTSDSQVTTVVTPRLKSGDSQVTQYNKDITNTNKTRRDCPSDIEKQEQNQEVQNLPDEQKLLQLKKNQIEAKKIKDSIKGLTNKFSIKKGNGYAGKQKGH